MLVAKTKTSLARIEVQQSFCDDCSGRIKKGLQEINGIANVRLYPLESLVCFNFMTANNISTVLNILSDLGYNEIGEKLSKEQFFTSICCCSKKFESIHNY